MGSGMGEKARVRVIKKLLQQVRNRGLESQQVKASGTLKFFHV